MADPCIDTAESDMQAAIAALINALLACFEQETRPLPSPHDQACTDITDKWNEVHGPQLAALNPPTYSNVSALFADYLTFVSSTKTSGSSCVEDAWAAFTAEIERIRDALLDCLGLSGP